MIARTFGQLSALTLPTELPDVPALSVTPVVPFNFRARGAALSR
jgi:hypothetical protein